MTSAVIVNIDSKIKERAMKRAKNEGLSLSTVIKSAIQSFAEGKISIGIIQESFNAKTRREILQSLKDIKAGRNLSPRFTTVAQMKKYLDN